MTKCKELFLKYGGHKLAAGLSLEEKNIELFRKRLNEACVLTEDDLEEKIIIDVPMPLSYVSYGFMQELNLLEPFGMGNTKPVFAQKNLKFLSMRIMGKNSNMAKFVAEDEEGNRFSLILFRHLEQFLEDVERKYGKKAVMELQNQKSRGNILMNIIYYPSINEYMGKQEIQFIIQNWN